MSQRGSQGFVKLIWLELAGVHGTHNSTSGAEPEKRCSVLLQRSSCTYCQVDVIRRKQRVTQTYRTERFFSVQLTRSDSCQTLRPHGLQHARPPCPSPTPRACSNSCPSSRWCHPTIVSSVIPFFSCLQSFPASGSFQMGQFFASGGQSIGASASAPSSAFEVRRVSLEEYWNILLIFQILH